jgi:hypothetical protein
MAAQNGEMASAESGSENAGISVSKKNKISKNGEKSKNGRMAKYALSGSENGGHRESNKRRRGGGMALAAKAAK